jgi:hypothetical protein
MDNRITAQEIKKVVLGGLGIDPVVSDQVEDQKAADASRVEELGEHQGQ